jgi:hypothetical protein
VVIKGSVGALFVGQVAFLKGYFGIAVINLKEKIKNHLAHNEFWTNLLLRVNHTVKM